MKDALFFSSQSQYVFIHDALLESIMCGDNSIKAPELKKKVEELRQVVPETGVSGFETQFKVRTRRMLNVIKAYSISKANIYKYSKQQRTN